MKKAFIILLIVFKILFPTKLQNKLFINFENLIDAEKFKEAEDFVHKHKSDITEINISKYYYLLAYLSDDLKNDLITQKYLNKIIAFKKVKPKILSKTYNLKGILAKRNEKYQEAYKDYLKAIQISKQIFDSVSLGKKYHNLAILYDELGLSEKSINSYRNSLKIKKATNYDEKSIALSEYNLGGVYYNYNNYDSAAFYYQKFLNFAKKKKNEQYLFGVYNNLGLVYSNLKLIDQADLYLTKALELAKGNKKKLSKVFHNLGIHYSKIDFKKSIQYLSRSIKLKKELSLDKSLIFSLSTLATVYSNQGRNEEAIELADRVSKKLNISANRDTYARQIMSNIQIYINAKKYTKALNLLNFLEQTNKTSAKYWGKIRDINNLKHQIYTKLGKYKKALESFQIFKNYVDSIDNQNVEFQLIETAAKYQNSQMKEENTRLVAETEIQELKIFQQRIILILAFSFLILISLGSFIIIRQKMKVEELLLNVLPKRIAEKLKKEKKIEPERFSDVTILISDFVNFTKIAEIYSPSIVVNELNEIYSEFDKITSKYNCERLKTQGDAYFAMCGIPISDDNHARNIINSALEFVVFLNKRNLNSEIKWQIRVGIDTGEVVGAILGLKKFAYDIYGDTVNMAARLEQSSKTMKIVVSESTREKVKCIYKFISREPIELKNMGTVTCYFVESKSKI